MIFNGNTRKKVAGLVKAAGMISVVYLCIAAHMIGKVRKQNETI